MNTVQLECFVEVASTLSFAQAAFRLNMTQPAVSKQVKSLEGELGVVLFERTTRSVELTAVGEGFLADALEMLSLMRDSTDRVRRRREAQANILRVGYTDTVELVVLSRVWRQMRSGATAVHPILHCGLQDDNSNAVAQGKLDVALGMAGLLPEVGETAFVPLRDSTLRCVLPARNRFVSRGRVSIGDLAGMAQVVCAPADFRRRGGMGSGARPVVVPHGQEVFMCSSAAEACSLVKAGLGFALIPSHLFMPSKGLRAIELEEAKTLSYGIFVRSMDRAPIVDEFIELLTKQFD